MLFLDSIHSFLGRETLRPEMIAPTSLPLPCRAATAAAVTAQPQMVQRQVAITQTLTSSGTVFTTVVTLGRGGSATDVPSAPSASVSGSSTSGGLTQEQIGIIVGCCVGAAVLVVLLWCCLAMARRRRTDDDGSSTEDSYSFTTSESASMVTRPSAARWSEYHRVRPPVQPIYRAVVPEPRWTARPRPRADPTYTRGPTYVRR
ncbi:hypothetical protein SCAR479_11192 [Seiridium cardinale]|uniref:Transmembrane protein n=1 Tax=Seiridium cardinale TaxID=138064 RepID=A0ABR2XEF3_9PEZI